MCSETNANALLAVMRFTFRHSNALLGLILMANKRCTHNKSNVLLAVLKKMLRNGYSYNSLPAEPGYIIMHN